jgi:hypothetical protein
VLLMFTSTKVVMMEDEAVTGIQFGLRTAKGY